jgi:D-glutamate N-acetyltransferase
LSWVRQDRPCKVVGLSLVTFHLNEQEALDAIKRTEDETGLPATDVIRFGADILMDALLKHFTI